MAEKKRRQLYDMNFDEISFVDRGGNQHADLLIFKRDAQACHKGGEVSKCEFMKGDRCSHKECPNYMVSKCYSCGGTCKGAEHVEKAPEGVQFNVGYEEDGGSNIQSVLFDKEHWTEDAAKVWLEDHRLMVSKLDQTETSLRFQQRAAEDYVRFRVIKPGPEISKTLRSSEGFNAIQSAITLALRNKYEPGRSSDTMGSNLWIRDLYWDQVVFDQDQVTYQVPFVLTPDGNELSVTIGERTPVEVVYQPIVKAAPPLEISPEVAFRVGRLKANLALAIARR